MTSYQSYDEKDNNFVHDAIYFTNYDPENDTLLKTHWITFLVGPLPYLGKVKS
jgi:hypothetical protein